MNLNKNENTVAAPIRLRKLNAGFTKIAVGSSVVGKMVAVKGPMVSKTYDTTFYVLEIAPVNAEEPIQIVLDGGLRGSLKMAGLLKGNLGEADLWIDCTKTIEIAATGKTEVDGFMTNTYDIFEVKN